MSVSLDDERLEYRYPGHSDRHFTDLVLPLNFRNRKSSSETRSHTLNFRKDVRDVITGGGGVGNDVITVCHVQIQELGRGYHFGTTTTPTTTSTTGEDVVGTPDEDPRRRYNEHRTTAVYRNADDTPDLPRADVYGAYPEPPRADFYGAYPVYGVDRTVVGYRPTDSMCLMRNMRSRTFCSICKVRH